MEKFSDMFESSIGNTLNTEVALYTRFQTASKSIFEELASSSHETRQNAKQGSTDDKSTFAKRHLDITGETKLLREVKDINDELGIIQKLFEVQARVLQEVDKAFESMEEMFKDDKDIHQIRKAKLLICDQARFRDHAIKEIEGMAKKAHIIYANTKDLLNLEQLRAQSIEAWFARSRAESTARQGQTIMVFTIVTVIFLPMSFIAAFFAIDITDLPHVNPGQQAMSLSYVATYLFGIGVPFAFLCILIGFQGDILNALRFLKKLLTSSPKPTSETKTPKANTSKASTAILPRYERAKEA